ncbi:MAG: hypothetical protein Q9164_000800 [Protoblastenia rupestris]
MAKNETSKVNSPQNVPRKPLAPGPNSWAQTHQQQESTTSEKEDPRATNRDRYENKPIPKLPSEVAGQIAISHPKPYIQPAIPLVGTAPLLKGRAVTDPLAPKALFTGRKPSVNQFRNVSGQSKHGSDDEKQPSPSEQYPTGKAAQVLGVTPVLTGPKRSTAPSCSPTESSNEAENKPSSGSSSDRSLGDTPQVNSSPLPARRHLRSESDDNGVADASTTPDAKTHRELEQSQQDFTTPVQNHHKQIDSHLAPPKIANYRSVGEVGVIQSKGMHRVESFQGVIESALSPEEQTYAEVNDKAIPKSAALSRQNGQFLQPVSYSPNNYRGVWENDPAVVSFKKSTLSARANVDYAKGYSLPPFSPMPNEFTHERNTERNLPAQNSALTTPSVFGDNYTNASFPSSGQGSAQNLRSVHLAPHGATRFTDYKPPLGSANSWASESRNNSFASEIGPVSALLPPNWPHHHLSNSVPSPPHTRQDYQRPDPLSAGLSQLDLTIHHHIDTAFGSLSRLVTDKHDRVRDQVIRRIEDLEDGFGKNFRQIKSDLKGINSEVGRVKAAIHNFSAGNESIKELVLDLQGKLITLEQHVEENKRHCQQIITNQIVQFEDDRQPRSSTHGRTESAHGALDVSQDRHMLRDGASRTSSKARTSNKSSRGHRSNTVSSPTNGRVSEDRGARRDYLTDLAAVRGPVPDIREHPAYAGIPQPPSQMYDQNGVPIGLAYTAQVPYGAQQLGDGGWYQQAYGSG